jgi:hypothetical protein
MRLRRFSFVIGFALAANMLTTAAQAQPKPKFESKVVNRATMGQAVNVEADITGAKSLFLVVQDGGDGFGCDWADWIEPKLVGPKGETKLTVKLV